MVAASDNVQGGNLGVYINSELARSPARPRPALSRVLHSYVQRLSPLSRIKRLNFIKFSLHVTCGCGSFLLCWLGHMYFRFVDNVMFSCSGYIAACHYRSRISATSCTG